MSERAYDERGNVRPADERFLKESQDATKDAPEQPSGNRRRVTKTK